MAHITFIHGILNKPAPEVLLRNWKASLADDAGLDLDRLGITTSMVYWADVLYPRPEVVEAQEAVAAAIGPDPSVMADLAEAASQSPEEAAFLAGLAGKYNLTAIKANALDTEAAIAEAVPLPWVLKEPLMATFLRDVHHYLFNTRFTPRPGETFLVRDEIRRRFVKAVSEGAGKSRPHVVVSHSMGTVIAYDCLRNVAGCPAVDALMTIGSPLGLDEVEEKVKPQKADGFPSGKTQSWSNLYDRLDPVCGFAPVLAGDYRQAGRSVLLDYEVVNSGWWRHNISKYLGQIVLRHVLREQVRLSAEAVSGASEEQPALDRTSPVAARDMTPEPPGGAEESRQKIVTWPQLEALFGDPSGTIEEPTSTKAPSTDEVTAALRVLHEEGADHEPGVLFSPTDRLGSLLQSAVASELPAVSAEEAKLEIVFDKPDTKKVLGDFFAHASRIKPHEPMRPKNAQPEELSDSAKMFLVSDFGTGLYGAPRIALTIANGPTQYDVLLHLGDVYYSGQPDEVKQRLLAVWPFAKGKISRTLNGNHDMYSGGYGYFGLALPEFRQSSSYFAMQNKHWTLICLDTAYVDNDLDDEQVAWIHEVVDQADERGIVLFSHHPLFSNFKDPGEKLEKKLKKLLKQERITAWYWGHEHHSAIYARHPDYHLYARCLGHGGMPSKRKDFKGMSVVEEVGEFTWVEHRSKETPRVRYLDGPNRYVPGYEEKYAPHGYMTLSFDKKELTETCYSADGEPLHTKVIRQ